MVAAAAAVLNAAKTIAGIDDEKYVIAPNVFRDIQDLKANILKHDRTSLNVEEILTALSISAERNPCAQPVSYTHLTKPRKGGNFSGGLKICRG